MGEVWERCGRGVGEVWERKVWERMGEEGRWERKVGGRGRR